MSADPRISLSFEYLDEQFMCGIYFPNLKPRECLLMEFDKEELKGIEALVRSLADLPVRYKKCPFCDDTWPLEMIENRDKYLDSDTCYKVKDHPTFKWSDQPVIIEKNSKLKVTFGAGTWTKSCSEVASEGCIHNCEKCVYNGEIKDIIESLRKIEQLCHELGVQCYYVD
jgi:hypothetical protein